jgi:hypothetical protein
MGGLEVRRWLAGIVDRYSLISNGHCQFSSGKYDGSFREEVEEEAEV